MLKDDKKESEVRYKNPTEYAKYINRTYDCMKENAYRIEISERLYYRRQKIKRLNNGWRTISVNCHIVWTV